MSSYSDRDTYSQASDWLLGAVRRNPEALLLMAAGCCLMMRGGRSSSRAGAGVAQHMRDAGFVDVRWESLSLGIAAIHVGRKP